MSRHDLAAEMSRACAKGDVQAMAALVARGAGVNMALDVGQDSLMPSAIVSGLERFKAFRAHRPLHVAARSGHVEACEWLLDQGANMEALDNHGLKAHRHLTGAVPGHGEVFQLLVRKGAQVAEEDLKSWMNRYCEEGDLQACRILLDHGVPSTLTNLKAQPVYHAAVIARQEAVVQELAARGVHQDCVDRNGFTVLHEMALRNRPELMQEHMARGANINARGANGYTPLHAATDPLKQDAFVRLVELGADPWIPNDDGRTAVDMAMQRGSTRSVMAALLCAADFEDACESLHRRMPVKSQTRMMLPSSRIEAAIRSASEALLIRTLEREEPLRRPSDFQHDLRMATHRVQELGEAPAVDLLKAQQPLLRAWLARAVAADALKDLHSVCPPPR